MTITASEIHQRLEEVQTYLGNQLIGHDVLIRRLLVAVIANGHILIEGAPGLAKTRAVNQFAKILDADFARVQATPDLLPADITGTNIFQQHRSEFEFTPGPLFNNVVLVDEINRAPPKVQSALLEAMAERQITTAGVTRELDAPFMVVATQNSLENEGTYPLPEAQLDRFMFYLHLDLPDAATEKAILSLVLRENRQNFAKQTAAGNSDTLEHDTGSPSPSRPVITADEIRTIQSYASNIHIAPAILEYITRIVCATRDADNKDITQHIRYAASPRGSIAIAEAAQATAVLNGRDHVLPEDVQELAADALGGRIGISYRAQAEGIRGRDVINSVLQDIPVV